MPYLTPHVVRILEIVIALAIAATALYGTLTLIGAQPWDHDEAVYAIKARSLIEHTPAEDFGVYRPIGMAGFGWALMQWSFEEERIRIFGALFAALTAGFLFLYLNRLYGVGVALAGVSIAISSPLLLEQASLFQNDIASAGLLVGAMWLTFIYYESLGKSNAIYIAALLAGVAFYTRYGAIISLFIIAFFSYLILIPRLVEKEKREPINFSKLGKAILLFIGLLIPHVIHSLISTRSPFGILTQGEEIAGRKYLGEGLVTYTQWFPGDIAGWPLEITALIGVVATIVITFLRRYRQEMTGIIWAGYIGIGTFLITGLLIHAEARYIIFPLLLLSGAGIAALFQLLSRASPIAAYVVMGVIALAALPYGVNNYAVAHDLIASKSTDRYRVGYVAASEAIRNDAKGECAIWALTTYRPAVSWYSRCHTFSITTKEKFDTASAAYAQKPLYSIVLTKASEKQITPENAAGYGVTLTELFRTTNLASGARGDIVVYRITKNSP